MNEISILNRYSVFIGEGILDKFPKLINLKKYSSFFLIVDQNLEKKWSKKIEDLVPRTCGKIIIQSGEQSKNIETVQKVWQALVNFGCDRKSLVINIGGGMTGDLGGFAASSYMRGIDFLQIPTTLLAQVDASIGGKLGINFLQIKNLIGCIQQPIAVIIDVDILNSLPKREFISGFSEIIKHGAVADKKYFDFVTSKKPLDFSSYELVEIIKRSCQIKANVVSCDEEESGPRKLLNFGHTVGHAIESLSQQTDKPLLHGEAISIGMYIEARISQALGLISNRDLENIKNVLLNAGLPISSVKFQTGDILSKIKSDKKNISGKINFTLLKNIGQAIYDQTPSESIILQVLQGD